MELVHPGIGQNGYLIGYLKIRENKMEFRYRGNGFWSASKSVGTVDATVKIWQEDNFFTVELWSMGVLVDTLPNLKLYPDAVNRANKMVEEFGLFVEQDEEE